MPPLLSGAMKRAAALLSLLSILVIACGDDDTSGDGTMPDAQREWCTFPDASEESAQRFDQIFEAGLADGLEMDALNARADARRLELLEQGLDPDAAVRRVSEELFDDPTFVEACALGFETFGPGAG